MYVVTVEFQIAPACWEEFLPLMLENAHRSLVDESGCRQFDVCVDGERKDVVFLYELYDDRSAFDVHLASPHFKRFAAANTCLPAASY